MLPPFSRRYISVSISTGVHSSIGLVGALATSLCPVRDPKPVWGPNREGSSDGSGGSIRDGAGARITSSGPNEPSLAMAGCAACWWRRKSGTSSPDLAGSPVFSSRMNSRKELSKSRTSRPATSSNAASICSGSPDTPSALTWRSTSLSDSLPPSADFAMPSEIETRLLRIRAALAESGSMLSGTAVWNRASSASRYPSEKSPPAF